MYGRVVKIYYMSTTEIRLEIRLQTVVRIIKKQIIHFVTFSHFRSYVLDCFSQTNTL